MTFDFSRKKIVVMRIGLLGRGVGDTAWLAEQGADVLVVDSASEEVMKPSVDMLAKYDNVKFKFGPYDFTDFVDADFVLVGAGTPLGEPVLQRCRDEGVKLKQSAAWFAELAQIPIIGVTGTRGKSTVTHIIHHVLERVTGEKILLGGNIRGVSNLQLLKEVKEDSLCVMELDSWQLQGWGWSKISPQIAVFTNFMEDHLNYYQAGGRSKEEAMELYFLDKANIFKYQKDNGVLVTIPEVFARAQSLKGIALGQEVILVDDSILPEDTLLSMPGKHNRLNAALAVSALKSLSLTEDEIYPALATFSGVEGRLQYLGSKDGVVVYNDNNATTPQATIMGLEALGTAGDKNIILIAGGADKNIDLKKLQTVIDKYCKQVILLPGSGTDKLKDKIDCQTVSNMEKAVSVAFAKGKKGDIVLFSPAFASFGLFKNEYERNDEFVSLVNKWLFQDNKK